MLKVAVSGINATDNPGPGVPIARSLKEAMPELTVHGLSYDLHDPGHYLDFLMKDTFLMPFPTQGWQAILSKLLHIKQHYGLDCIIPSLDAELPLFVKYQHELKEYGIATFLPTLEQFDLRSKDKLAALCETIGCHYPETKIVTSFDNLTPKRAEDLSFPIIVKGKYYEAYFAYTAGEILRYANDIAASWGMPILLQKPVYGEEINLVGLGDGLGNTLGVVAIKKLKTTKLGKIWSGITIENPKLIELAGKFVKTTKWRGPFELEVIQRSNEPSLMELSLIEINPRFPAWVYFATGVGINLPQRMMQLMNGETPESHNRYQVGKYFIRYTYEIVTDLDKFQRLNLEEG